MRCIFVPSDCQLDDLKTKYKNVRNFINSETRFVRVPGVEKAMIRPNGIRSSFIVRRF